MEKITSFYENAARLVGVPKEEIKNILPPPVEKKKEISTISLSLKVDEDPRISISADGPIIELQGDNQRYKTVSLLYLCNLLGYDFENKENGEFLANPEIIFRGDEILQKLKDGMKAVLNVKSKEIDVSLSIDRSWVDFKVISRESSEKFHEKYDLKTMLPLFRKEIKKLVDLRFVSKGRDFDRQILKDISRNIEFEVEKCHERVSKRIEELLDPSLRLLESWAYSRQGAEERLGGIKEELGGLESEHDTKVGQVTSLKDKLGLLKQLKEVITENENKETFKKLKEAFELKSRISRLEKRKNVSEQIKEKNDEVIRKKNDLKEKGQEFSSSNQTLREIDKAFGKSLDLLRKKKAELDLSMESSAIEEKQIAVLREQAAPVYGEENLKILETITKTIAKYDGSLKVPKWGTLQSLREMLNDLLDTVKKHIFVRLAIEPIIDVFDKYGIKNDGDYQELLRKNSDLKQIVNGLRKEITLLQKEKAALERGLSKKELEKIREELGSLQSLQSNLKSQLERMADAEDFSLKLHGLAKGIMKEGDDPLSIIYSPDWESKLESREIEINKEIESLNIESLDKHIQELREQRDGIKGALAKPERQSVEKLRDFKEVLDSLKKLLQGEILINRARSPEEISGDDESILKHLETNGILKELDKLINSIFLERCKWYFSMEKKCKREKIIEFDYLNRTFDLDKGRKKISELSGGTSSSMTVLSLASGPTDAKLGCVLLVDEFGDVGPSMRKEVYNLLRKESRAGCATFVRLTEGNLRAINVS